MAYEQELRVALDAASHASTLILHDYAAFRRIPEAPADISTDTDRRSQDCIIQHIRAEFPADAVCAEEATPGLNECPKEAPRAWIIDPIDGTRGFARKNGEFSVMIALVEQGRIALGVVAEPEKNRLTYSIRGAGCWKSEDGSKEPGRCQVTRTADLGHSTITQSHSRNPSEPSKYIRSLKPARVIETYSAGIKLAQVARGEADIYLNTYDACHDWDICAGMILVEEAGGQVTNLRGERPHFGRPGAIQQGGLLATNSILHSAALAALRVHC
jgi:3'(2'), 5'-bisphosphate nucleotidase